jgi:hypothetical protein
MQHPTRTEQHPPNHAAHANVTHHESHAHGRITDAHYTAHFGSSHRFHVSRIEYQRRRFVYGGYTFGFADPWPPAWAYSDPVYVVYVDNGYYMYDPVHPGIRITLNIF